MMAQFMGIDFQDEVDYWNRKRVDWIHIAMLALLKLSEAAKALRDATGGVTA